MLSRAKFYFSEYDPPNALINMKCTYNDHFWCPVMGISDVRPDKAGKTRIYLLLSDYMCLWCWSRSCTLNLWHMMLRGGQSLLAEAVLWSLILSSSTSQNPDMGSLTLLWAADSSDRPATEIDVAQIENRGRMAIMSSQEKHVSLHCNTIGSCWIVIVLNNPRCVWE